MASKLNDTLRSYVHHAHIYKPHTFLEDFLIRRNPISQLIAYVFPGQGSQFVGMGSDLFGQYPELTDQASQILGYSIRDLCVDDPDKKLKLTQFTQPALFVVNTLSHKNLMDSGASVPLAWAGHSLEEYNALLAAGAMDFESGLRLVQKRGELMGRVQNGGMAAVIGLSEETIVEVLKREGFDQIDLANMNTPTQIVLSGLLEDLEKAQPFLEDAGASLYLILPVSAAFHSRFMTEAQNEFALFLKEFSFSPLSNTVISNVTGRPYQDGEIAERLSQQVTGSVKWTGSVRYMMAMGIESIVEIGPGKVLTGLIAKIKAQTVASDLPKLDAPERPDSSAIHAESLGSPSFRKEYGVRYAYYSGSMYKGIASNEIVIQMGRAGLLGFLGTGGLSSNEIETALSHITKTLTKDQSFGVNLLANAESPDLEEEAIDLYLKYGVTNLEASAFTQVTPALVRYRLKNVTQESDGRVVIPHRIIAKISRPEVATAFMSPAPAKIREKLLEQGKITEEESRIGATIPMAGDICVESDSAGHTDMGVASVLLPSMILLKKRMQEEWKYSQPIRVGAAGGIGTPEAAAATFMMGADFICTGSINQCTVEAGQSDPVKDLLADMNVQDTDYAPAGDMFEFGAKVQVLKKGLFFPARANKLFSLYQHHHGLDDIDEKTKKQIEEKFFGRTFEEVWKETKQYYEQHAPQRLASAERNPKQKMALIFRWYFVHTTRLALSGSDSQKVDYQIHCGPALGAFNQWVKGTKFEDWKNRHVDEIAEHLMTSTATFLNQRIASL